MHKNFQTREYGCADFVDFGPWAKFGAYLGILIQIYKKIEYLKS